MNIDDFSKKLFNLIHIDFKGLNLTSIDSYEDFYHKQIEDSLLPFSLPEFKSYLEASELMIDVGFGGGFPLLPLSFSFPGKKFIGFDAREKKVKAVNQMASSLSITNVKAFHGRIEDYLLDRDCLVTFKAVGDIYKYSEMLNLAEDQTVRVLFYKGQNFESLEQESIIKILESTSYSDFKIYDLTLSTGEARKVCTFVKKVPRRTTKSLISLDELV